MRAGHLYPEDGQKMNVPGICYPWQKIEHLVRHGNSLPASLSERDVPSRFSRFFGRFFS
jgi:hypothetical protein